MLIEAPEGDIVVLLHNKKRTKKQLVDYVRQVRESAGLIAHIFYGAAPAFNRATQ